MNLSIPLHIWWVRKRGRDMDVTEKSKTDIPLIVLSTSEAHFKHGYHQIRTIWTPSLYSKHTMRISLFLSFNTHSNIHTHLSLSLHLIHTMFITHFTHPPTHTHIPLYIAPTLFITQPLTHPHTLTHSH